MGSSRSTPAGSKPAGGSNAPARADLGLAVDAVDPERARRVAVDVVADDVPVAPAEHDAVGLEPARSPAVPERNGRPPVRVEQRGQRRGVDRRASAIGVVGALPLQAAELGQALAARRRPSSRTAVTATWSAARSSSVRSSSGR